MIHNQKKVAVISLSQGFPVLIRAGARDGLVVIVECLKLPNDMRLLREKLNEHLEELRKKGYVIIVDEVIPYFSRYGRAVRLEDVGQDGKPIVVSAIEIHKNLTSYGVLQFSKGVTPIDIPESVVDEERGDRDGKLFYRVDWEQIDSEQAALLLALHSITNDHLLDNGGTKRLFNLMGAHSKKQSRAQSLHSALKKMDEEALRSALRSDEQ